jgi:hypothetical protein
MEQYRTSRRSVLRAVAAGGAVGLLPSAASAAETAEATDPTTRATYRAIVDAVVPNTPALAADLGPEHEPGGLELGMSDYLIAVTNSIFSLYDAPELAISVAIDEEISLLGEITVEIHQEVATEQDREFNARLAELVGKICDAAATELVVRGGNAEDPDPSRFEAGGIFASLSRSDRLRALALLDEREIETTRLPNGATESTAALVPQLLVAFTEGIYYSEWEGYDDIRRPPSEREFSETVDGERLQSWRQTEFPGVIAGSNSFRGYWGTPRASLGEGRVWKAFPADGDGEAPKIYYEQGSFTDNDFETGGYEEPYDTSGEPPSDGDPIPAPADVELTQPEAALEDAREGVDDELFAEARTDLLCLEGGDR